MDAWLGYEDLKTLEPSISPTKAQTTKNFSWNTNTTFLDFNLNIRFCWQTLQPHTSLKYIPSILFLDCKNQAHNIYMRMILGWNHIN